MNLFLHPVHKYLCKCTHMSLPRHANLCHPSVVSPLPDKSTAMQSQGAGLRKPSCFHVWWEFQSLSLVVLFFPADSRKRSKHCVILCSQILGRDFETTTLLCFSKAFPGRSSRTRWNFFLLCVCVGWSRTEELEKARPPQGTLSDS